MMMQARPRTAGTAARRKQRALATARARSDSRHDIQSRARSASVVANGTTTPGTATTGSSNVGPSMVIPKVLFIVFMVCLIIGGIMIAITTLEDAQLGSTKLVGVFIIVGGCVFLIAAIVVCMCKKARWAADHADDDDAPRAAGTATSSSARRSKYAANHVEDETSRPPTRAWNMDGDRPTSAYSTRDIEMTLTPNRQNDLFSISGNGTRNGGFQADDQLNFHTTPQIKITCEDDEEKDGKMNSADDFGGSNMEDVKIVMGDENLVDTTRPAGIPALDLSGVFPSPSVNRKSFENEAFNFDLGDGAFPMDSATASLGTSDTAYSPVGTQLNQSTNGSDWSTGRSTPKSPMSEVNGDIELKVIKADVTDNLELIQPETAFKGSQSHSADITGGHEKEGVSDNVSPRSVDGDKRSEEDNDTVPFDLGLLVGGRGRVE